MNLNQIGLMGMGVTLIIGGVFIHMQLGRIFDQQTKKNFDNPELQQRRESRILMIRAMEGVLLLAGVGRIVAGWLVGTNDTASVEQSSRARTARQRLSDKGIADRTRTE